MKKWFLLVKRNDYVGAIISNVKRHLIIVHLLLCSYHFCDNKARLGVKVARENEIMQSTEL